VILIKQKYRRATVSTYFFSNKKYRTEIEGHYYFWFWVLVQKQGGLEAGGDAPAAFTEELTVVSNYM
jgi:hypothetical protein